MIMKHASQDQKWAQRQAEILRKQLYGSSISSQRSVVKQPADQKLGTDSLMISDVQALNHDLRKILIFSSLAIGVQFGVWFII